MRRLCAALGLAMLLLPAAVAAQSDGAIVVRGEGDFVIAWVEFDGVDKFIISSTYPDFGCGVAASRPDRWQIVTTPVAAEKYHEVGQLFTRVYVASLAEWLAGDPEEFVCTRPYAADGILSFNLYDTQADAAAPGANIWGHMLNGTLRDTALACKTRMVKIEVIHLWRIAPGADYPACYPGCAQKLVWKGATAECVGK